MQTFFEEAFYPAGDREVGPPPMTDELLMRMLTTGPKCGLEFVKNT